MSVLNPSPSITIPKSEPELRVHLLVEWLNGDQLDDDTLFDSMPDDIVVEAAEMGCLVFARDEDPDPEKDAYVLINIAATRRIEVTPYADAEEPRDAPPVDAG